MIVVEEILNALFIQIPEHTYMQGNVEQTVRKPFYHFGDRKEANKFIKGHSGDCYPLIYQISNEETHLEGYVTTNLELVLCTQNKNIEQYNSERWELSYKNVLVPLADYVQQALIKSLVIASDWSFSITKEPNYGVTEERNENAYIDIVDALILTVTVKFQPNRCLNKNIKFNT